MGFRGKYNKKKYRNREQWEAAIAADRGPQAYARNREALMTWIKGNPKTSQYAGQIQAAFDKYPVPADPSKPPTAANPAPNPAPSPAPSPVAKKVVPKSNRWSDIVDANFPSGKRAGGAVKRMAGGGMVRGYGCAKRGLKISKKMG